VIVPPSAAPVRTSVAAAQNDVARAKTNSRAAKAAVASARVAPDAPALKLALDRADGELDALSTQLLNAGENLEAAQIRVSRLESDVKQQTADLMSERLERQSAVDGLAAEKVKHRKTLTAYHRLKTWLGILAATVAGWFAWRLLPIGPYRYLAAAAGAATTFAAVWLLV
jgi:predicted  nucleic acid-binding Zn-ribbon protein